MCPANVDGRKHENSSFWKIIILVASTCRRSVQFGCYVTGVWLPNCVSMMAEMLYLYKFTISCRCKTSNTTKLKHFNTFIKLGKNITAARIFRGIYHSVNNQLSPSVGISTTSWWLCGTNRTSHGRLFVARESARNSSCTLPTDARLVRSNVASVVWRLTLIHGMCVLLVMHGRNLSANCSCNRKAQITKNS